MYQRKRAEEGKGEVTHTQEQTMTRYDLGKQASHSMSSESSQRVALKEVFDSAAVNDCEVNHPVMLVVKETYYAAQMLMQFLKYF